MAVEDIEKLPVPDLIKHGESARLEFKGSFQSTDNNLNEKVQISSIKTIAAFLNTKGGILLIGVEDNGEILGLDTDYSLLGKRKNWDGFSQKFTSIIIEKIGKAFMQYITVEPYTIEEKQIAVLRVRKSHSPAFLTTKNKQGKQEKFFYIRANNTTHALDIEETHNYLLDRMKSSSAKF